MISVTSVAKTDNDVAIRVESLSKCYRIYPGNKARLRQIFFPKRRYYEEFWALKDINFEVSRGEALGIIGPNGAGKSTLLQILAGILQPTMGKVEVNGRVSALLELGAGFDPQFTGRENAYMNGAIMGLSRKEMGQKIDAIREFADIGDFFDRPVRMYSSGMYVRLAFAVATSVDPEILIVDEALAVGDMSFQRKCNDRMNDLRRQDTTILFVSHGLQIVENLCSKVILLEKGRIEKIGQSAFVINHYQMKFQDVNFVPGDAILKDFYRELNDQRAAILSTAEEHSVPPSDVEIQRVTVLNGDNEPCTNFKCSDRMKVRVEYVARKRVLNPVFSVGLYNSKGIFCYGARTAKAGVSRDAVAIDAIEGEGSFEVDLREIRLNSDIYMVGVAIFNSLITLHYALNRSLKIRVNAESWNSNVGIHSPVVICNANWRFLPREVTR